MKRHGSAGWCSGLALLLSSLMAVACTPGQMAARPISGESAGGEAPPLPVELATSPELLQTISLCRRAAELDRVYPSSARETADAWPHVRRGARAPALPPDIGEFLAFCRDGAALASFVFDPAGRTARFRAWERFVLQTESLHSSLQDGSVAENCVDVAGSESGTPPDGLRYSDTLCTVAAWTPPRLEASQMASLSITTFDAQRSAVFGGLDATALMSGIAHVVEERAHQEVQLYIARNLYGLLGCEEAVDSACPADPSQLRPAHFLRSSCSLLESWREDVGDMGGSLSWGVLADALETDLQRLPENMACLAVGEGRNTLRDRLLGWIRAVFYLVGAMRETLDPVQIGDRLLARARADGSLPAESRNAVLLFGTLARLSSERDIPSAAVVGAFRTLGLAIASTGIGAAIERRVDLRSLDELLTEQVDVVSMQRLRQELARLGLCAPSVSGGTSSSAGAQVHLAGIAGIDLAGLDVDRACTEIHDDDLSAIRAVRRSAAASLRTLDLSRLPRDLDAIASGQFFTRADWEDVRVRLTSALALLGADPQATALTAALEAIVTLPDGDPGVAPLMRQIAAHAPRILPALLSDAACGRDRACAERLGRSAMVAQEILAALAQARSAAQALSADQTLDEETRRSHVSTLANAIVRALFGAVRLVNDGDAVVDVPVEPLVQAIVQGDGAAILSRSLRLLADLGARLQRVPPVSVVAVLSLSDATRDAWLGLEHDQEPSARDEIARCVRASGITTPGSREFVVRYGDEGQAQTSASSNPTGEAFPYRCVERALLSTRVPHPGVREVRLRLELPGTDGDVAATVLGLTVHETSVERLFEWDESHERAIGECFPTAIPGQASPVIIVSSIGEPTATDVEDEQCVEDATNGLANRPETEASRSELARRTSPGDDAFTAAGRREGTSSADSTGVGPYTLRIEVRASATDDITDRLPAQVVRALAFGADLMEAETTEDFERVIDGFAAPVGSYAVKRRRFSVSVTALFALHVGGEFYVDRSRDTAPTSGFQLGGHASLGLDITWPLGDEGSLGFYVPILNLTPFSSFSLNGEVDAGPSLEGVSLVSPGLYGRWGIFDTPVVLAFGASYTPDLRRYDFVGTDGVQRTEFLGALQVGVLLAVDVTLFGF